MPRHHAPTPRLRPAVYVLCAALGLAAPLTPLLTVAPAFAQALDQATEALFLAVDKNDLPGVQDAVAAGADIKARDFNGMQAVDLAIDRGYFDIAHYLISVRNQQDAAAELPPVDTAAALPDMPSASPPPPPAPTEPPEPMAALPEGQPNPFETPQAGGGLPVLGEVREPETPPRETAPAQMTAQAEGAVEEKPSAAKQFITTMGDFFKPPQRPQKQEPEPEPEPQAAPEPEAEPEVAETPAAAAEAKKPSATQRFITTFTDFFKPPNTTGIVRKPREVAVGPDGAVTETELSQEIKQIEAELGDAPIKGPAVPIEPEELARELPPAPELPDLPPEETAALDRELPPYPLAPAGSQADIFGDMKIEEAKPQDQTPLAPQPAPGAELDSFLVSDLPFGGGVDPDILALLGEAPAPVPAPVPAAPKPEVPVAEAIDPFAQPPEKEATVSGILKELGPQQAEAIDPFAQPKGVDELAGLPDGRGEKIKAPSDGWDVKEVESAAIPSELPVLSEIEPSGEVLEGVELSLGADTVIGQEVGEERLKRLEEETIHKPCLIKDGPQTLFCVDKVNWPFDLEDDFLVDTIMYQGTRAIARYDAGRATNFHALFKAEAFEKVIGYYIKRFGPPSEVVQRAIAPLAQPRRDNPTYIWRSREPGTDTVTTLEIRKFDDARGGGFPDTKRGVIMLYRTHSGSIFPQLSQLELMVLKAEGNATYAPKTPDSIW